MCCGGHHLVDGLRVMTISHSMVPPRPKPWEVNQELRYSEKEPVMQEELEMEGTVGTLTRQPCTYSGSGRKFLRQSEQAEGRG